MLDALYAFAGTVFDAVVGTGVMVVVTLAFNAAVSIAPNRTRDAINERAAKFLGYAGFVLLLVHVGAAVRRVF